MAQRASLRDRTSLAIEKRRSNRTVYWRNGASCPGDDALAFLDDKPAGESAFSDSTVERSPPAAFHNAAADSASVAGAFLLAAERDNVS